MKERRERESEREKKREREDNKRRETEQTKYESVVHFRSSADRSPLVSPFIRPYTTQKLNSCFKHIKSIFVREDSIGVSCLHSTGNSERSSKICLMCFDHENMWYLLAYSQGLVTTPENVICLISISGILSTRIHPISGRGAGETCAVY